MIRIFASPIRSTQLDDMEPYANPVLYRVYDRGELPDDLDAMVQRWANELLCLFFIDKHGDVMRGHDRPSPHAERVYPQRRKSPALLAETEKGITTTPKGVGRSR